MNKFLTDNKITRTEVLLFLHMQSRSFKFPGPYVTARRREGKVPGNLDAGPTLIRILSTIADTVMASEKPDDMWQSSTLFKGLTREDHLFLRETRWNKEYRGVWSLEDELLVHYLTHVTHNNDWRELLHIMQSRLYGWDV